VALLASAGCATVCGLLMMAIVCSAHPDWFLRGLQLVDVARAVDAAREDCGWEMAFFGMSLWSCGMRGLQAALLGLCGTGLTASRGLVAAGLAVSFVRGTSALFRVCG
jgi:hypothetical protein